MKTMNGSEAGAASPAILAAALEMASPAPRITDGQGGYAPGACASLGRREQLLLLVARLWRANEDWVVLASDLSRRESMDLSRHTERVRMVARVPIGFDPGQLSIEVASLTACLPADRTPEAIRVLLAQIRTELVRLRAESTDDAQLPAPERATTPASDDAVPGAEHATSQSDGNSSRALVVSVMVLMAAFVLAMLVMHGAPQALQSGPLGGLAALSFPASAATTVVGKQH
jgi:hypothetical protein